MNSFKSTIRSHRLIFSLVTLVFLVLAIREIFPARANGVVSTILSGQVVTGNITGTGKDDYTFYNTANRPFVVTMSEIGAHSFVPVLNAFIGAHTACSGGNNYLVICAVSSTQPGGTWTAEGSRSGGGTTGGNYNMQLAQEGGLPNGTLTLTQTGSGSLYRGDLNVFTVWGIAGTSHPINITVTPTGGPTGWVPEAWVIRPSVSSVAAAASSSDVPPTSVQHRS